MDNTSSQSLKSLKIILIFIAVVIVVLTTFHLLSLRKFRVVSTEPTTGQFSSAVPFFKINFNKTLVRNSLELTSSPSIISSYVVDNKAINISLEPLTTNEVYTVTIRSVTATDGEVITNKTLRFTAKYINTDSLPKDQQQAILHNQDNYSSPSNNPIVAYLPHQTLSFALSALITNGSNGKPALVLQAVLLLNQAEMSNETAALSQDKQAVLSYIQSLGLNPSNYNITYTVSQL